MKSKSTLKDTDTVLLWTHESKAPKEAGWRITIPTAWDGLRKFYSAAATINSSLVYIVVVTPLMKLLISAFSTGCLLFRPLIHRESPSYWIHYCSRFIIFTKVSVATFLSLAFLPILSSRKVCQNDHASFLASRYSFQAIFSLSKNARDVK